jgi:hypothetical protein
MTFLAPTAMLFLLGISIPIIIHFLNKLNVKKVEFSSIRYLKSMKKNTMRSIKFKKLILLLLRIGIISALALMLARPVTKGFMPGWLSAEIDSRLLLVIDNSSSMDAQKGMFSLLENAKRTAIELIAVYGKNTSINIVQTCPPQILFSGKAIDSKYKKIINQVSASKTFDNIWFLVDSLTKTMKVNETIKECIIISDFQTRDVSIDSLSDDWKYYFINSGSIDNNMSISNLDIVSRIKVPDQLIKIKTTINNSNSESKKNIPIDLLFEENRVGQVISNFEKKSNKDFFFQAYPSKKGILKGSVRLPKDDYLNDNIWYMSTPILNKINCLIVCNTDKEKEVFNLIVNSIDPEKQLINVEFRKQPIINRLFIDDVDILVIHNPGTFTESAFNELDVFLKNGGGLIWFSGGMEADPSYGKYFSNLNFPMAQGIIKPDFGIFNVSVAKIEDHALTDLNVRKLSDELPEVFQYVKHIIKAKQKVHLKLNNGDPLLIDFKRGNGQVFYFSSLLDLDWNDMPLRGLLVPLMYKLLILGGTDEVNSMPIKLGKTKWVVLDGNEVRSNWEVEAPSGVKHLIVPDFIKESLKIKDTNELGVYNVYKDKTLYTSFSTELNPNEIISNQVTQNEIAVLFPELKYRWLNPSDDLITIFNEIRHGKALWKFFLILAIALFLLETWVGRPTLDNTRK